MRRLTRGQVGLAAGGVLLVSVITAAFLAVDRSASSHRGGEARAGVAARAAGGVATSTVDRGAVPRRARRVARPLPVPAGFPRQLAAFEDFDPTKVVDYGLLPTRSAGPHHVFLAHKRGGGVCLVDLSRQAWAIGCDADLFSSQPVMFEETFAGVPSTSSMRGIVIAGIAQSDVANLELTDESGATHHVPLTAANAFAFQVPDGAAQAGAQPSVLVARAKDGSELGRITDLAVG
jgi:hypothetical protein